MLQGAQILSSDLDEGIPMTVKTLAIASDHGGVELKSAIVKLLEEQGVQVLDLGTNGPDSVDYPDYAQAVAKAIIDGKAEAGILVCGSGIGMSMAANRYPQIRAALVHDRLSAELCRQHNNANVLCLGARLIGEATALDCVDAFMSTEFEGGRHEGRVAKMSCSV
jgi:ribose 5-phosphate isomerase B